MASHDDPVASQKLYEPSAEVSGDKVPVDQLSAANAITSLAEVTNLPVAGDLREATTTLEIKKEMSQSDADVITKPQIVQPEASSQRGIIAHRTKEGENVESIARQYGVTSQTIRWANNMTSDAVEPDKNLTVPMVDGVVYTIKDNDNIDELARKYKSDVERVILYNDLSRDNPLPKNTRIVLPGGVLPEDEQPGYTAPNSARRPSSQGSLDSSGTVGSNISYGYGMATAGNRYAPGNCTWYVYERRQQLGRPIGGLWGNAYSWETSARSAGFRVDKNPVPGSIIQTPYGGGGYGHVGLVERVDESNVYITEMNYRGYNVVSSRTIPKSSLGQYNFIH